jgi:hypothetical protein
MANQAYLTYTEVDAASRLTVAANTLTIAALDNDENAYLYKDFTASYFSGDFGHVVKANFSAKTGTPFLCIWAMANAITNIGAQVTTPTGIGLAVYFNGTHIVLAEMTVGTTYSTSIAVSLSTDYYIRITRDESVGTYGTLYCHIYTDSQFMNLVDSMTLTLHSKTDFQYLYAMSSQTGGAGSTSVTATIEDLQLEPYAYCVSELITRIRDLLNESSASFWTDTELLRFINDGERDIAIQTLCLQKIDSIVTYAAGATLTFTGSYLLDTTTVENSIRTIPFTGYKVMFLEWLKTTSFGRGLNNIYHSLLGHTPSLDIYPTNWYQHRDNIYIESSPTDTYNLKAYIADYPSKEMSLNPDIPEIPPAFRPLIVLYVVATCLIKDKRVTEGQMIYSMYLNELIYNRYNLIELIPDTKAMTNYHEFNKVT